MTKLSWDQVLAFRLDRQFLHSRAPAGSLFEVASALCGVRAQLPSTAELALWARVDGLEHGEVKQALEEERTLVKTWIRNTLHVVPADDLALYVAVLRPRPEGPGDAWLRLRGVTRKQYEAIVENVPRALDGRPRTREWLADRLAELVGPDVREAVLFSWGASSSSPHGSAISASAHRGGATSPSYGPTAGCGGRCERGGSRQSCSSTDGPRESGHTSTAAARSKSRSNRSRRSARRCGRRS
jgi:hypothetical protein